MVALALSRRDKETRSGNVSPAPEAPSTPVDGKPSPELAQLDISALDAERQKPKRSASFGRSLGGLASLTSGMAKASDAKPFNRVKSGTSTPQTPALPSPGEQPLTPSFPAMGGGSKSSLSSMGPPVAPDASHLTQFSLKLSDLVNKAFAPCTASAAPPTSNGSVASNVAAAAKGATSLTVSFAAPPKINQITYEGKHLPDKAKIIEIAQLVVGELRYAEAVDAYLLRAVSRQILKALTLFAARIDSLLVSPTKDPSALKVPANAKEGIHLPAALEFNLGLVTLEWIVEDSLERCIEGDRDAHGQLIADDNNNVHDGMPHFVSEILTPVRKKMEGTILHIIQPLLVQVKTSIARCMSTAVPSPFVSTIALSPTPTNGAVHPSDPGSVSPSPVGNASPPQKPVDGHLPSIAGPGSTWLRELDGRLDGARRLLLPRIEERCGQDGEGWFISVAIHIIWKGLLILTSRSVALPVSALTEITANGAASVSALDRLMGEAGQKRSPSPAQLAQALKSVGVGSVRNKNNLTDDAIDSGRQTPVVPHGAKPGSLAPISMVSNRLCALQLAELQTFEKLMLRFCEGFLRKPDAQLKKNGKAAKKSRFALFASSSTALGGNQPTDLSAYDPDEEDELARAALAEAMHALKSTIIVLQAMEREPAAIIAGLEQLKTLPSAVERQGSASYPSTLSTEAAQALDAIPNLLLLQTLYNRLPLGPGRLELPSPPVLFAYTWTDYEKAIAGFAGGDQWAQAAALRYKAEIEKAWRSISMRKAEKLAVLETKRASERGAGAGPVPQRAVSASSSTRLGSTLAQSTSLSSDDDSFDPSEDGTDTDALSHSVPVLQKPKTDVANGCSKAMASDTNLAAAAQATSSDDIRAPSDVARGRPSPSEGLPRRSASAIETDQAPSSSVGAAATAAPKFWRRSSSNVRSGFHLSFSGLRSQSSPRSTPTNELTAEPTCASPAPIPVTDPMSTALRGVDASPLANSTPSLTSTSVHPTDSIATITRELPEKDRILLEASLEQKALCMFAKAITYAGGGQVHLDLR